MIAVAIIGEHIVRRGTFGRLGAFGQRDAGKHHQHSHRQGQEAVNQLTGDRHKYTTLFQGIQADFCTAAGLIHSNLPVQKTRNVYRLLLYFHFAENTIIRA